MKPHPASLARLAVGLAALGLAISAVPAAAQEATPVIVEAARYDRFVDRVEALGTLRANESVDLTATVTDTVTAIHFEDGQRVEAGHVLVEMTHTEQRALLEEARATVAEARVQYERVRPLAQRGAASRTLLDERRREYETAQARVRALDSRVRDRLIVAPFAGVLGLRSISLGALIEPGDLIATLDDDSVMKLDFTVPSTYLATLVPGLPIVALAPALGEERFEGTVASVDSRIDPVTRAVRVRALVPNPRRTLKPGLLMAVELLKNGREALVIPEEALIPRGRENSVLVVDRSGEVPVARQRPVTIGARRPGEVEIVEGLEAGELVVTHGTLRVRPGQPVTILAVNPGDSSLTELLREAPGRSG
jgi:membrane fusion protein (multidrug efflux system)